MKLGVALACLAVSTTAEAAGACPHPLMPLQKGASWVYRTAPDERVTLMVRSVESRGGSTVAIIGTYGPVHDSETAADAPSEPVFETSFLCGNDGADLPFANAVLGGSILVETLKSEGPTLAPPGKLSAGSGWKSTRTLRVGSGEHSVRSKIAATHTVGGSEKITTPAGSWDALRIDVESEITSLVDAPRAPDAAPARLAPRKSVTHLWFARGVGLLRMTTDAAPAGAPTAPQPSLELLAVSGLH